MAILLVANSGCVDLAGLSSNPHVLVNSDNPIARVDNGNFVVRYMGRDGDECLFRVNARDSGGRTMERLYYVTLGEQATATYKATDYRMQCR